MFLFFVFLLSSIPNLLYNRLMNKEPTQNFVPPVVAVLGHVDHGKTTLLDAIRKTNIAGGEHGGITQKIGASEIEIVHEGLKRSITFIDTPGHAAFAQMRGRGVQAADICLLVVSVIDGVMPQTKEAISLLRDTPFIVVLTKSDAPDKNPEKVKQQLVRENVLLEGYGGDVPVMEVSARTGQNIQELLDLILLVFEIKYLQGEKKVGKPDESLQGIVIEAKLDQKSGPRATVIIKHGKLIIKDILIAGTSEGKVKALFNTSGKSVQEASVGQAVEVLGFEQVPPVGSVVYKKKQSELTASKVFLAKETILPAKRQTALEINPLRALMEEHEHALSVFLCADTQGSLEAIRQALPKDVHIVMEKTGEISEADILFAKSTGSLVLSFNTRIKPDVARFAITEKVLAKNYTIIYEMLDEIKEVLEGKKLAQAEQIFGTAKVLASFPYEKTFVLGVKVQEGRLAKNDRIRLIRQDEIIGESIISSLRQGKNQTSKVEEGQEAGVLLSPFIDFQVGDMIISHS